jgi:chromate transporter
MVPGPRRAPPPRTAATAVAAGGLAALAWTALKVGALSFGGGFVIIPLMRADAVGHHWMTSSQFLNAVALGQITPGPVVQTVAAVGYAAAGVGGGLLAALIAFSPSFVFVLGGARYFGSLRGNRHAQAFLDGAGPPPSARSSARPSRSPRPDRALAIRGTGRRDAAPARAAPRCRVHPARRRARPA